MTSIFDHCFVGNIIEVRRLLDQNTSIDQIDQWGRTLLHIATAWGHFEMARILLQYGARTDIKNYNGETALHTGIQYGGSEIARLLIASGADVNAKTDSGITPLHIASTRHSGNIIIELLNKGADPNVQDNLGRTPLYEAIQFKCDENAKILLPYTNLYLQDNDGKTALEIAYSNEIKELIEQYLLLDIKEPDS